MVLNPDLVGLFVRQEKREVNKKYKETVTVLHFTDELRQTISLSYFLTACAFTHLCVFH